MRVHDDILKDLSTRSRTQNIRMHEVSLRAQRMQSVRVHAQMSQHMHSELDDWWPVLWHWNDALVEARKNKTITALSKHNSLRFKATLCQVLGFCGNPSCCGGRTTHTDSQWQYPLAWRKYDHQVEQALCHQLGAGGKGGRGRPVIRIAMLRPAKSRPSRSR